MTIDTEPLVEPLAHTMCTAAHRMCVCGSHGDMVCVAKKNAARAAIAYLLPLIVERCAEESSAKALEIGAHGKRAAQIATAVRALIPAKGRDHE